MTIPLIDAAPSINLKCPTNLKHRRHLALRHAIPHDANTHQAVPTTALLCLPPLYATAATSRNAEPNEPIDIVYWGKTGKTHDAVSLPSSKQERSRDLSKILAFRWDYIYAPKVHRISHVKLKGSSSNSTSGLGLPTPVTFPLQTTAPSPTSWETIPPGKQRSLRYIPEPIIFRADFVRQKNAPRAHKVTVAIEDSR